MALISKPYTFTVGATIVASEHNSNFDTIFNDYNGNITNANVSGSAQIAYSKLSLNDSITNADISTLTSIADSKLAQITTAGKVSGAALTSLSSIPSAAGAIPRANMPVGAIVQIVNTQTGTVATGTTIMPMDNTTPQITEGDQYMSLSVTPTSATNKLLIEVVFYGTFSVGLDFMTVALFQNTTANAIATGSTLAALVTAMQNINLNHYMTAGTTSAITFKVRAGGGQAGTTTFNGNSSGNALFNGTLSSSITISEVAV